MTNKDIESAASALNSRDANLFKALEEEGPSLVLSLGKEIIKMRKEENPSEDAIEEGPTAKKEEIPKELQDLLSPGEEQVEIRQAGMALLENGVRTGEIIMKEEESDQKRDEIQPTPNTMPDPRQWPWRSKWWISMMILLAVYANYVFSTLLSIYSDNIEQELPPPFSRKSLNGRGVAVSIFNLGNTIGPIFFAPLSERFGRLPMLRASGAFFIIVNTACGFTTNQTQLMCLRLFAGILMGAPIALCQVILAELWGEKARGKPLCLNSLAVVIGPSLGNVIGGWTQDRIHWRWMFWSTSILAFIVHALILFNIPETYRPMLKIRVHRRRKSGGQLEGRPIENDGIQLARSEPVQIKATTPEYPKGPPPRFVPRPLRLGFTDPLLFILSIQMGMIYTLFYMAQTHTVQAFRRVFKESMHLSCIHCICTSIGAICASKLNTKTLSRICDKLGIKCDSLKNLPEYRFRCMIPGILFLPVGTIIFGFTTQRNKWWIIPDLGLVFLGFGIILSFRKASTYMVDTFGPHAASALAALNLFRRLASFLVPLFIKTTQDIVEYKWIALGASITALAVICPMPLIFFIYGHKLRRLPVLMELL